MPTNAVSTQGLTIQTRDEIVAEILDGAAGVPGLRSIYGSDINVDPNSPDGQLVNLIAQAKVDVLELVRQVYTSFDPSQAVGVSLNSRALWNGITRKPGTYTQQDVDVTVSKAVTLPGLDTQPTAPFTVADSAGTQYYLIAAHSFSAAGTTTLAFRAAQLGAVESTPNTITTPVTILSGVTSVNNPDGPVSTGQNEETDYAFRLRRTKSVSLPSQGLFDGLVGALWALDGVAGVKVLQNTTGTTDANGVPGHSIWCIVDGGTNLDIGTAIYRKVSLGCGVKGDVTVPVTQADGGTYTAKFSRPTDQNLYLSFNVTAVTGSVDASYLRSQILTSLTYDIYEPANASGVVAYVRSIAPNASVDSAGVSTDGTTYVALAYPTTVDRRFALSAARIKINGFTG